MFYTPIDSGVRPSLLCLAQSALTCANRTHVTCPDLASRHKVSLRTDQIMAAVEILMMVVTLGRLGQPDVGLMTILSQVRSMLP